MKIEIESVSNGYVLSWQEEVEDGVIITEKEVIMDNDEKESMSALLHRISDYFGLSYDKWGEENLRVSWDEKGHKI